MDHADWVLPPENNSGDTATSANPERQLSFARRALLKAGWTVPVILAVGLTPSADAGEHYDTYTGIPRIHLNEG